MRFTALLHHITPHQLVESFYALRHDAAAGVDGVTWRDYEEVLYERVTSVPTATVHWLLELAGRVPRRQQRRLVGPWLAACAR